MSQWSHNIVLSYHKRVLIVIQLYQIPPDSTPSLFLLSSLFTSINQSGFPRILDHVSYVLWKIALSQWGLVVAQHCLVTSQCSTVKQNYTMSCHIQHCNATMRNCVKMKHDSHYHSSLGSNITSYERLPLYSSSEWSPCQSSNLIPWFIYPRGIITLYTKFIPSTVLAF